VLQNYTGSAGLPRALAAAGVDVVVGIGPAVTFAKMERALGEVGAPANVPAV
jgi:hypothetical protein